jgi:hypothetical protein
MNRRQWIGSTGAAIAAGAWTDPAPAGSQVKSPEGAGKMKLDLSEFQPKSMLHVPETKVSRGPFSGDRCPYAPVVPVKIGELVWASERKWSFSLRPTRSCRSWIARTFESW